MYCSACGGAINPGLSYCNHCGARIGGTEESDKNNLPASSFNFLVAAVIAIPTVGIGMIMGLLVLMKKELGLANDLTFAVLAMCFILLLASEGALLWLLISRAKRKKYENKIQPHNPELKNAKTKELQAPTSGGIYETGVPTVTEHTTRQLDAVPIRSKKQ